MFERFTERARQVVVLAQDDARSLRHGYIGTEHLLLGLLREEEGLAARALSSLGVELGDVRAEVARIAGTGDADVTTGQIPFTPRAKQTLEVALREASALGHDWIGTEHILLALVRDDKGVGARALLDRGLDGDRIREEVLRLLGAPAPPLASSGRVLLTRSRRRWRRGLPPLALVAAGWLMFALALGVGIVIGWAIWG